MTKAPQTRVQRIFGHLKRRSRNLETLPQWRVSSDVIGSADRVLGRIPVSTAKTEINAALGIIQGMEIVSPVILSLTVTSRFIFPGCCRRG